MSRDHSQNHYGPNASFDGYDSDLASAGILIESLRQQLARCIDTCATRENEIIEAEQQLAAALAACKQKDDALEKIRGHIGLYNLFSCVGSDSYDPECADLNVGKCGEIATKALAIRPGTEALDKWIGEQSGWTHSCPVLCLDGVELWIDRCPHCGRPAPKGLK